MLKWHETDNSGWQQLSFYSYCILPTPVGNMAANYICIKYKSKVFGWKEISYVDVTWYMDSTY